ncbi:PEP-CTERM sorting domain-containing protein [Duganella sp. BJB475]|nr:PEP-CTERM sorting domain-containing protein [Duganella sp. BJB475]RFP24051.1 PEP-CTERM sorting domain-containing protein [Duganella sp. BJB476]
MLGAVLATMAVALPASAAPFFFSTGGPDGLIGTATRPSSAGKVEIETADDFILGSHTSITSASFTGLLTGGATAANIGQVVAEIYRVFPKDSTNPPSGRVPTRTNSPSDVAFDSRDSGGGLTFSVVTLGAFSAANSVLNGINPLPGPTTGGEGPISGTEVTVVVNFGTPFDLPADHYFFVPQVEVTGGEFYWLSAAKPVVGGTGPFAPDLQSWIRNEPLAPDWLRIGTDIVGAGAFNASFSLVGATAVAEPGSVALLLAGVLPLVLGRRRRSPVDSAQA